MFNPTVTEKLDGKTKIDDERRKGWFVFTSLM